jgi:hypothetical protein
MISPLPDIYLTLKGQQWTVIGTADSDEGVIDTIRNNDTGELKSIERMKLLKYLEKFSPQLISDKEKSVNLSSVNNQLNFKL